MTGMLYLAELTNTYFVMNNSGKSIWLFLSGLLMLPFSAHSQVIHGIMITNKSGLTTERYNSLR